MSGFNLEKGADRRQGLRASDTPDKGRMTRPLNKTQQAQAEGRRSRREVLNYLLECLTSPANPATAEQITEFKMTSFYFPEIKQAIETKRIVVLIVLLFAVFCETAACVGVSLGFKLPAIIPVPSRFERIANWHT
jgi:hypothetical protein